MFSEMNITVLDLKRVYIQR